MSGKMNQPKSRQAVSKDKVPAGREVQRHVYSLRVP